jgi:hypothetical protein
LDPRKDGWERRLHYLDFGTALFQRLDHGVAGEHAA